MEGQEEPRCSKTQLLSGMYKLQCMQGQVLAGQRFVAGVPQAAPDPKPWLDTT